MKTDKAANVPTDLNQAELSSEIYAVRQWMTQCESEGLQYPVRARILNRLLDISERLKRVSTEDGAIAAAREYVNDNLIGGVAANLQMVKILTKIIRKHCSAPGGGNK